MKSEKTQIDIAIIGGGIIGLSICRELLLRYPQYTIALFEKESYLLEHTSGRNSEVLHAGIYYPTNSLKHKFCLEGNIMWREYVKKNNLDFLDCGKFIVDPEDTSSEIDSLFEKAKNNNVPNISWANQETIKTLSQSIRVKRAFYSPTSAVLNVAHIAKKIQQDIESKGGIILLNNEITSIEKNKNSFLLTLQDEGLVESHFVINAGGLGAVSLRKKLGLVDYSDFRVKGNYLLLKKPLQLNNLIYPLPPKDKMSLGVHLTLDTGKNQKFGPDSEHIENIDYKTMPETVAKMFPSIKKLFYTIEPEHLQLAYSGIRPKIKDAQGKIIDDFIIQSPLTNYIELLGIESPGLTASPAIAKFVADKI